MGEFGSVVWDREERPRVNMLKLGRGGAAIVTDLGGVDAGEQDTFEGRIKRWSLRVLRDRCYGVC